MKSNSMSLNFHDPRDGSDGQLIVYSVVLGAVLAVTLFAVMSLLGPRQSERFAKGAYECRPFVGQMPGC